MLLARPTPPGIETVNDKDCWISNFWRAVQADAETVAGYCDWPVNEADIEARHLYIVNATDTQQRIKADPDYYDAKLAGWWCWGLSSWIGSGWCAKTPIWKQIPHLGNAGKGVHRKSAALYQWFDALQARLRYVRVCCGDWTRVMGPSVTVKNGMTAVFLDPPYSHAERDGDLYAHEMPVADAVREWAIENGVNPLLRVAICGYEGEHAMPEDWECVAWKANGGYGSQSKNGTNSNAARERVWFSPACLRPSDYLFDMEGSLT